MSSVIFNNYCKPSEAEAPQFDIGYWIQLARSGAGYLNAPNPREGRKSD